MRSVLVVVHAIVHRRLFVAEVIGEDGSIGLWIIDAAVAEIPGIVTNALIA